MYNTDHTPTGVTAMVVMLALAPLIVGEPMPRVAPQAVRDAVERKTPARIARGAEGLER